jgi:hypothetical protein
MAFIDLPYGIKLVFTFSKDGQICINVMWCTKSSPVAVTSTDLANALLSMQAYWNALRSSIMAGTTATQFEAIDWSVSDGAIATNASPTNPAGALGGNNVANNVSMALTLITGQRGRSRRGRSYIVGLGQSDFASANVLSVAAGADIVAAYQVLKTSLNGYNLVPVVASFISDGAPRVSGIGTAITAVGFTDGFVDSQRRRLPGRGI